MRSWIPTVALALIVIAVIPYTVLKLLWLGDSTIGTNQPAGAAEVQSTRMVIGNIITLVLELLAVGLAVAMTRPWGLRVPAWIVLCLAGGATGLLAPILLGLPLGSVIQFLVQADVRTSGMDGMAPWVFAVVYGGFGLLAIAIAVLGRHYVLTRWGHVLAAAPRRPAAGTAAIGAVGMLPFAVAMLWWGVTGPGDAGPQGMEAIAQRTTLVVTGLLTVLGWLAPLVGASIRRPHVVWLAIWVGCATGALQGPAQVLLADGGVTTPTVLVLALLTTPASFLYGTLVLRQRVSEIAPRAAPLVGV